MGVGCSSCCEKKSHSLILVGLDAAGKVVLANIVPLSHKRSSSVCWHSQCSVACIASVHFMLTGSTRHTQTTWLYRLQTGESRRTTPTIVSNFEEVVYKHAKLAVWDLGGIIFQCWLRLQGILAFVHIRIVVQILRCEALETSSLAAQP
jgi:hypothetical protein